MNIRSRNLRIKVEDINVIIKKKEILKDITCSARSGEILAIMGPTGSGKTTLLNAISGRQSISSGTITLNGAPFRKQLRRNLAFVQQQDVFFSYLTLAETLRFTANIRMPDTVTDSRKQEIIDGIVNSLQLNKCLNTVIGNIFVKGLSGGEKKRASIACELLTDTDILILDEPTSGLDSATAHNIMNCMQNLSKQSNKMIILTIHQPSSKIYYMFDRLLLLSEGQLAYFGRRKSVLPYFEELGFTCEANYNPADFLLEILLMETEILAKVTTKATHLITKIKTSSSFASGKNSTSENGNVLAGDKAGRTDTDQEAEDDTLNDSDIDSLLDSKLETRVNLLDDQKSSKRIAKRYSFHHERDCDKWATSWFTQYKVLAWRSLKEQIGVLKEGYSLVIALCVSVLCSLLYFQVGVSVKTARDVFGLNFFYIGYWTFIPAMTVIGSYPAERPVIAKERASGAYRLSAYFLAKVTGDLPDTLIHPVFMYAFFFWVCNMGGPVEFFTILTVMLIQTTGCFGLGLCLSVLCTDIRMAITVLFSYLISMYLLGGFFSQSVPFWMEWIKYASIFYYPYAFTVSTIFEHVPDFPCNETSVELFPKCGENGTTFLAPKDVLAQGNVHLPRSIYVVIILIYSLVLRHLAYVIMRLKRDKIV